MHRKGADPLMLGVGNFLLGSWKDQVGAGRAQNRYSARCVAGNLRRSAGMPREISAIVEY